MSDKIPVAYASRVGSTHTHLSPILILWVSFAC
jgi:hypothetical protein